MANQPTFSIAYAIRLTRYDGDDDGGPYFVVNCRDLPDLLSQGDDVSEAIAMGADALDVVLSSRLARREEIPAPSPPQDGEHVVMPPAQTQAKVAIWQALRTASMSQSTLATALGTDIKGISRLLNPAQNTQLAKLDNALAVLGRRLRIDVVDALAMEAPAGEPVVEERLKLRTVVKAAHERVRRAAAGSAHAAETHRQ